MMLRSSLVEMVWAYKAMKHIILYSPEHVTPLIGYCCQSSVVDMLKVPCC